jgi:hypothetical protein
MDGVGEVGVDIHKMIEAQSEGNLTYNFARTSVFDSNVGGGTKHQCKSPDPSQIENPVVVPSRWRHLLYCRNGLRAVKPKESRLIVEITGSRPCRIGFKYL